MDSCNSSPIDLQSLSPLVDILSVYKMIFRAKLYLANEKDETKPLAELSTQRSKNRKYIKAYTSHATH